MVRKAEIKTVEGLRGGKGRLEMHHILKPEELNGHGRMYALVKMEPHSSIGVHDHIGETEPYYVLSGHGTFIDHDGSRIPVGPTMSVSLNVDSIMDLKMILMKSWS